MSLRSSEGCGGWNAGAAAPCTGTTGNVRREPLLPSSKRRRHGIRSRQNHRPQGVRNRQPNAMAFGEDPRGQVHRDVECINLSGFEGPRFRHGFALRAVDSCACNLRDGSVGSHIGEARKPVRQRCCGRGLQQRARPSQDGKICFERRGIVDQAERVHGTGIAQQLAPPESGLDAD